MKKIILIPLDERPCNYDFAQMIVDGSEFEILTPPRSILGNKKKSASINLVAKWLLENLDNAFGLVVSLDMLLYGGIVPSRLHYEKYETLIERINILRKIKENYPKLNIYGFQLLMRNPEYSSSEEEPDYYEEFGRMIHLYGVYHHKEKLGIINDFEKNDFNNIKKNLPLNYLNDYLDRRKINSKLNKEFLKLVKENIIDFGIIPQDDSSLYGLTALDQIEIRKKITEDNLELKVYMYPGADEIANVLVSRMILNKLNQRPKIYIKYSSTKGKMIIPLYEDRYLGETIKYQVLAAGGIIVEDLQLADIVLLINSPSDKMTEAANINNQSIEYDKFRTIIELVEFADFSIHELNKKVVIADVAYANGGDINLLKLIKQKGLIKKISAYAGWNTSSNTLGTAIPQGILDYLYPNRKSNLNFLALRYIEDVGYCSIVRGNVSKKLKPPLGYFNLDGKNGKTVELIKKELNDFIIKYLKEPSFSPVITKIYSPWNRMFETGLEVIVNED